MVKKGQVFELDMKSDIFSKSWDINNSLLSLKALKLSLYIININIYLIIILTTIINVNLSHDGDFFVCLNMF